MWKKVELAELALLKAACKVKEKAEDAGIYASLAKNVAAEAAVLCQRRPSSTWRLWFYKSTKYPKSARDAHIIDIYEGVREVQNMIIGREIV